MVAGIVWSGCRYYCIDLPVFNVGFQTRSLLEILGASNATTNHLRNLNYNGTSSVYMMAQDNIKRVRERIYSGLYPGEPGERSI